MTEAQFVGLLQDAGTYAHVLFALPQRRSRPDEILAYMIWRRLRASLHLVRLAVDPEAQRGGCGRRLLEVLERKAGARFGIQTWVAADNLAAQLWLRACGYRCAWIFRNGFDGAESYGFVWPRPGGSRPGSVFAGQWCGSIGAKSDG